MAMVLLSAMSSYFTHMDRFFAPTFMPLDDDVVRVRRPTVGVFETAFNIGNMPFRYGSLRLTSHSLVVEVEPILICVRTALLL